jgi:hypothetical protein
MAALGNALYTIGCILAGLVVLAGIWFLMLAGPSSLRLEDFVLLALFPVGALLVWGVGRGLKYVLSGQ